MRKQISLIILYYLRYFAQRALQNHRPIVIGIAGSVGKSSTRNALASVFRKHFSTKVVSGNSETGVPLGILGLSLTGYSILNWCKVLVQVPFHTNFLRNTQYLIVEMGIDDPYPPKNMEYLLTIIKPDIAISLNVTATHTEQFEKTLTGQKVGDKYTYLLEKIAEEDSKVITASDCRLGIYNADDTYLPKIIEGNTFSKTELLTFGEDKKNAISYKKYEVSLDNSSFSFQIGDEQIEINMRGYLLPKAYLSVFAPIILVAKDAGLTLKQIKDTLEDEYHLPKGRATKLKGVRESVIIDSSYNSSKAAVIEFLTLCKQLKKTTNREVVFLMGDMRELGNAARQEHEELVPLIHEICDYLYCVGPLTMEYILPHIQVGKSGLQEAKWFNTSSKAGVYIKENMPEKAIILVKGSQNTIFLEEGIKEFLADKKDTRELCRQETYWKKNK